ncbi:MAG: glycosyltransferase family 4 protein [Acidimicrobiales bacterium]
MIVTGSTSLFERVTGGVVRRTLRDVLTAAGSRLASANVVPSEKERSKLEKARAPRLRCVYHSVDTTFFRPEAKSNLPTAVMVAQLNPLSIRRKGVDTALRALAQARRSVPDLTLTIVGPISREGQVRLDQLRGEVDFTGVAIRGEVGRDEKRALLARSWMYLQPSMYEGFGVAVLEGMACACVPVSSKAGALGEVVGDVGRFVPAADPESLATEMVHLVHDRGLRERLGQRARERSQLFDSSVHVEGLGRVLRDVGWLTEKEVESR